VFKNSLTLLSTILLFACSTNDSDKLLSQEDTHASRASQVIDVSNARAIQSLPPHSKSVAFMKIYNEGLEDVILVGVKANRSEIGELYIASEEKNRLGASRMDSLVIPAESSLTLESDSSYLNFFILDRAWRKGEKVELTLLFAKHPEYRLEVEIQ